MTIPSMNKASEVFPLIIRKYEQFIPNIEGMGVPDKINAIIQYMNRIGKLSNDVVSDWNKVMKWVMDEGLNDSVFVKIDDLIAKGIFDDLLQGMFEEINANVLSVTTLLSGKIDKGNVTANDINISSDSTKIGLNQLSDATRSAIAGTASVNAVPSNDGITSDKIAPNAIRKYHLNFTPLEGQASKNLINPNGLTIDKFLNWSNGNLGDNTVWNASDYIRVSPSTVYAMNYGDQVAFYDYNKVYISGVNNSGTPNANYTFTTPANAVYVRIGVPDTKLATAQLEKGSSSTSYQAYGNYVLSDNTKINNINLLDRTINAVKLTEYDSLVMTTKSKNLFNKDTAINGKYVSYANGTLGDNASYYASDYIVVEPSTSYTVNKFDQVAFYDLNYIYISGVNGYQVGVTTFQTPSNAKYARVGIYNPNLTSYQFEKGSSYTGYASFQPTINSKYLPISLPKSIADIISKLVLPSSTQQVKLIGDSITAGVGGTGYATTGEIIYGTYQVNVNGVCWANSFKTYLEGKFGCTVKNWGVSGKTSKDLLNNISTLIQPADTIVICMIGTNDRNTGNNITKQNFYDNLVGIGNYVRGLGKEIIFMSNIPASIANETDASNAKSYHMEDVDHVIMKASQFFNQPYVSVYKDFIRYCDNHSITIDSLLGDGLHPNDNGYSIIFNLITNALGVGTKRVGATW
jgi:lysophospholipase L1-like esterase